MKEYNLDKMKTLVSEIKELNQAFKENISIFASENDCYMAMYELLKKYPEYLSKYNKMA
jgi:hypothetical protein